MCPLNQPDDIHTPEKFHEYVQTLEVARELLIAVSPAKSRLALIVLDNAAEVFMYRLCSELFQSDEFRAKILTPRFSKRLKAQVLWKFPEKVRLLKAEGLLPDDDAAVLDAAHSYRNQAVHRDMHNPRGTRAIASLLLLVAGRLLETCVGDVTIGGLGRGAIDWLAKYDLPTDHIDFSSAAAKIAVLLGVGLPTTTEDIRLALSDDLTSRLIALEAFPSEYLYKPSDEELAEMLKLEEFLSRFDEQAVAPEYREAVYAIAQGGEFPPEEFRRREAHYQERLRTERERFQPTLTVAELRRLSDLRSRLAVATSQVDVMNAYREADRRIGAYETALMSAVIRLEGAIQFQVDLIRGK